MARILNKLTPQEMIDRTVGVRGVGVPAGPRERELLALLAQRSDDGVSSIEIFWGPVAKLSTREELCDAVVRFMMKKPQGELIHMFPVKPQRDVREFATLF